MNSWEKPITDEEEYEEWKAGERVLAGVELTDSQVLDPSTVLSTQQTADYLTHLDTEAPVLDKDDNF